MKSLALAHSCKNRRNRVPVESAPLKLGETRQLCVSDKQSTKPLLKTIRWEYKMPLLY